MQHEQQVSQQDEMLDDMSTVVSRLQLMSVEMGEEIELQNQCAAVSFSLILVFFDRFHFFFMFQGLYPNHSLAVHLVPFHFLFQFDRHHRMIEGVSTHVDETQQRIDQMTAKVEKLLNNMGTVFFVDAHSDANMSSFSHSSHTALFLPLVSPGYGPCCMVLSLSGVVVVLLLLIILT